jgi:hypothetical protein
MQVDLTTVAGTDVSKCVRVPYGDDVLVLVAHADNFDQGEWAFFSPCTDGPLHHDFTASVYSSPEKPCRQHLTTNSKIGEHGTSLTVGPSYQLSYSSLPFRASGKLGGLTLKKQFERCEAAAAVTIADCQR